MQLAVLENHYRNVAKLPEKDEAIAIVERYAEVANTLGANGMIVLH